MTRLFGKKEKLSPPELPESISAEYIEYVKVSHCAEHVYLMRYVRLTFYLIIFDILYNILSNGMPVTLIAAITKLVRFL